MKNYYNAVNVTHPGRSDWCSNFQLKSQKMLKLGLELRLEEEGWTISDMQTTFSLPQQNQQNYRNCIRIAGKKYGLVINKEKTKDSQKIAYSHRRRQHYHNGR